jgi:hypothetical protein
MCADRSPLEYCVWRCMEDMVHGVELGRELHCLFVILMLQISLATASGSCDDHLALLTT